MQTLFAASAATAVAGFVIDRFAHPGRKVGKRLEEFFEDWNGEPARLSPDGKVVLRDRRPGVPERLEKIEHLVNGGGLGSQMAALNAQVTEHVTAAETTREEITARQEQMSGDIRDTRADLGQAVMILAAGQQRVEDKVRELDVKVNEQLGTEREKVEHLTAALTAAIDRPEDTPPGPLGT